MNTLDDIGKAIKQSVAEAEEFYDAYVAEAKIRKEKEMFEYKQRKEAELLQLLRPYLKGLSERIVAAGKMGQKTVYIRDVPDGDFVRPYDQHIILKDSTTAKLVEYLKRQNLKVDFVVDETTDSGVYNEVIKYYHYKLEVSF